MLHQLMTGLAALLLLGFAGQAAGQPGPAPTPTEASAFIGTWVIEFTEAMTARQTVKIWERDGALAASVGGDKSPATEVTGVVKDGNMVVLTISRDGPRPVLENGLPIWAIYALTLDGDTMKVALMLAQSRTIKRGAGRKQKNQ